MFEYLFTVIQMTCQKTKLLVNHLLGFSI